MAKRATKKAAGRQSTKRILNKRVSRSTTNRASSNRQKRVNVVTTSGTVETQSASDYERLDQFLTRLAAVTVGTDLLCDDLSELYKIAGKVPDRSWPTSMASRNELSLSQDEWDELQAKWQRAAKRTSVHQARFLTVAKSAQQWRMSIHRAVDGIAPVKDLLDTHDVSNGRFSASLRKALRELLACFNRRQDPSEAPSNLPSKHVDVQPLLSERCDVIRKYCDQVCRVRDVTGHRASQESKQPHATSHVGGSEESDRNRHPEPKSRDGHPVKSDGAAEAQTSGTSNAGNPTAQSVANVVVLLMVMRDLFATLTDYPDAMPVDERQAWLNQLAQEVDAILNQDEFSAVRAYVSEPKIRILKPAAKASIAMSCALFLHPAFDTMVRGKPPSDYDAAVIQLSDECKRTAAPYVQSHKSRLAKLMIFKCKRPCGEENGFYEKTRVFQMLGLYWELACVALELQSDTTVDALLHPLWHLSENLRERLRYCFQDLKDLPEAKGAQLACDQAMQVITGEHAVEPHVRHQWLQERVRQTELFFAKTRLTLESRNHPLTAAEECFLQYAGENLQFASSHHAQMHGGTGSDAQTQLDALHKTISVELDHLKLKLTELDLAATKRSQASQAALRRAFRKFQSQSTKQTSGVQTTVPPPSHQFAQSILRDQPVKREKSDWQSLNARECGALRAMYERRDYIKVTGKRPSHTTIAKWVGCKPDSNLKTALSTLVKAGYLGNMKKQGSRGGYFLHPNGELAGQHFTNGHD